MVPSNSNYIGIFEELNYQFQQIDTNQFVALAWTALAWTALAWTALA